MGTSRKHRIAILVAAALGSSAVGTGVATAASTGNWSCDATAARVLDMEEAGKVQAPGAPCATYSSAVVDAAGLTGLGGATDYVLGGFGFNRASAESTVAAANINVAGTVVRARALHATAAATCQYAGQTFGAVTSGASQSHDVSVNGTPVAGADSGAPRTVPVGPLATLYLNRTVPTPNGVTQRALELVVGTRSVLVLAEARAALISELGCFEFPDQTRLL